MCGQMPAAAGDTGIAGESRYIFEGEIRVFNC
jgi:hypothetical protein